MDFCCSPEGVWHRVRAGVDACGLAQDCVSAAALQGGRGRQSGQSSMPKCTCRQAPGCCRRGQGPPAVAVKLHMYLCWGTKSPPHAAACSSAGLKEKGVWARLCQMKLQATLLQQSSAGMLESGARSCIVLPYERRVVMYALGPAPGWAHMLPLPCWGKTLDIALPRQRSSTRTLQGGLVSALGAHDSSALLGQDPRACIPTTQSSTCKQQSPAYCWARPNASHQPWLLASALAGCKPTWRAASEAVGSTPSSRLPDLSLARASIKAMAFLA